MECSWKISWGRRRKGIVWVNGVSVKEGCHGISDYTHLNSLFSPLYAVRVVLQVVLDGRGQPVHEGGLELGQVLLHLLFLWINIVTSAAWLVTVDSENGMEWDWLKQRNQVILL